MCVQLLKKCLTARQLQNRYSSIGSARTGYQKLKQIEQKANKGKSLTRQMT